jgi:hypothetical protein
MFPVLRPGSGDAGKKSNSDKKYIDMEMAVWVNWIIAG